MDKVYRLSITEIDENGNERELVGEDARYLTSIDIVGEIDDDRCVEILVNDSLKGLAQKIAAGDKFAQAAKMAALFMQIVNFGKDVEFSSLEDELSERVEGGLQ